LSPPRCTTEDCLRDGVAWPNGPTVCRPCRASWAADHQDEISDAEWELWANENAYDTDKGITVSTWPDNFKTPVRPSRAQLDAHNERALKGWKAEREAAQKKRLEEYRDRQQYEPGFGQRRWGNR